MFYFIISWCDLRLFVFTRLATIILLTVLTQQINTFLLLLLANLQHILYSHPYDVYFISKTMCASPLSFRPHVICSADPQQTSAVPAPAEIKRKVWSLQDVLDQYDDAAAVAASHRRLQQDKEGSKTGSGTDRNISLSKRTPAGSMVVFGAAAATLPWATGASFQQSYYTVQVTESEIGCTALFGCCTPATSASDG